MCITRNVIRFIAIIITVCQIACGDGNSDGGGNASGVTNNPPVSEPQAKYTVGGNVTGLNGNVVLRNNGGDDTTLTGSGNLPFTFATPLADGSHYEITIATQPTGQVCTPANASGVISSADVTDIEITCSTLPPPTGSGGSLDTTFGTDGKVTTDFSGAPTT